MSNRGALLWSPVVFAFLGVNGAVGQQQPCYRIVDLGSLAGNNNFFADAFAITDLDANGHVQIVGKSATGMGPVHAFIWDNSNPPLMLPIMTDLGTLPGGTNSSANDINSNKEIVGQSETGGVATEHAIYWATPSSGPVDLGTLDGIGSSAAFGINENSTIVGVSDIDNLCSDMSATLTSGFTLDLPGGMVGLLAAGEYKGFQNENAQAFAINTPIAPDDPVIAGAGVVCGTTPPFCGFAPGDSNGWIGIASNDLAEPVLFGDGLGEALDVNDLRELVGWGRNENAVCRDRALFWDNVATTAKDIHTDAGISPLQQTKAFALNEIGQVVGRNTTQNSAYLWTEDADGDWSFANLNDEINSSCGTWTLTHARDINEDGWIVGLGSHPGSRAFLLIPIDTCLWDIAGPSQGPPDGIVQIDDYLALLAAWGPCPVGELCMADFDCTLAVGIEDYLALLAHWGPCPTLQCPYVGGESSGGSGSSGSGGGDDDDSGSSEDDVEDALERLGFDDMEEFGQWMDSASDTEQAALIAILAAMLL